MFVELCNDEEYHNKFSLCFQVLQVSCAQVVQALKWDIWGSQLGKNLSLSPTETPFPFRGAEPAYG